LVEIRQIKHYIYANENSKQYLSQLFLNVTVPKNSLKLGKNISDQLTTLLRGH